MRSLLSHHSIVRYGTRSVVQGNTGTARHVVAAPSCSTTTTTTIRTHMNHGGNHHHLAMMGGGSVSMARHGPRQPLPLGLEVAKASQNILRLLETTHGIDNYSFSSAAYQDMSDPCWHVSGVSLVRSSSSDRAQWTKLSRDTGHHHHHDHDHQHHDHDDHHHHHQQHQRLDWIPTISWLQFSDDRTALARVQAMDGSHRYLSLLRLDDPPSSSRTMSRIANDGWVILRELVSSSPSGMVGLPSPADDMISLIQCLQTYLDIEHGGGETDYQRACQLFSVRRRRVSRPTT